MKDWIKVFVGLVVIIGGLLIWLSFVHPEAKGPAEWLIKWTDWAVKYVALVVAATGIVNVANSVGFRIRHGILPIAEDDTTGN
jgi:hypothetical protein